MSDARPPDDPDQTPQPGPPPGQEQGWTQPGPPPGGTVPGATGGPAGAPPSGPYEGPGGWQQGPPPQGEGLDPKIGGMLSYLLLGWIGGLIMYFTQKNPEVRFHGAQSILVFAPLHVLSFILGGFGGPFMAGGLGGLWFFAIVNMLLGLLSFALWVFLSIQGYQLNHFKMPIVGDMAERWALKQP